MDTNANLGEVAGVLAGGRNGTFSSLIKRKQGKAVGRGADRKTYGDDLVQVVMITGFDYGNLVKRSLDILAGVADDGIRITNEDVLAYIREKKLTGKDGVAITLNDVKEARRELILSLSKSAVGPEKEEESAFEPLIVDGETVKGARVYKGKTEGKKTTKAVPGTIYLSGLKISEKVLDPSPNGRIPRTNSKSTVVAKNVLRKMLPVGAYVSYALTPDSGYVLKVGGSATVAALNSGMTADSAVLREVKRLLE